VTSFNKSLTQLQKVLSKKPIIKKSIKGLKKNSSGRNNTGKITVYHKGGGHKKSYRKINFSRLQKSIGITTSIEYDPNRNANIASVFEIMTNDFFYILAPKNIKIGDIVESGSDIEAKLGYALPLEKIPVGSSVHSVSTKPSKPATISRAAGAYSNLQEIKSDRAKLRLTSGVCKWVPAKCYATIGVVSNELAFATKLGKAGRSRWLNVRPTVRGVAMNPVDHPHGGGEGKKSGKGKTPWGKPVKQGRTRRGRPTII
jgi:large subunit ribosomal protein L2